MMPELRNFTPITVYEDTTIASGTTTDEIDLGGTVLCGIYWPASLASTSATIHTAQASGGTYRPISNTSNTDFSITVDTGAGYTYIDPSVTAGLRFIKIVMGASETAKTLTLAARSI